MRKIINKSNKKLVFPKFDLAIDPGEIKEITDEFASELLGNEAIEEVLSKYLGSKVEKETLEIKGRKKHYKSINE